MSHHEHDDDNKHDDEHDAGEEHTNRFVRMADRVSYAMGTWQNIVVWFFLVGTWLIHSELRRNTEFTDDAHSIAEQVKAQVPLLEQTHADVTRLVSALAPAALPDG